MCVCVCYVVCLSVWCGAEVVLFCVCVFCYYLQQTFNLDVQVRDFRLCHLRWGPTQATTTTTTTTTTITTTTTADTATAIFSYRRGRQNINPLRQRTHVTMEFHVIFSQLCVFTLEAAGVRMHGHHMFTRCVNKMMLHFAAADLLRAEGQQARYQLEQADRAVSV